MAITVNGKKVAGVGPAGLSPYQIAKAGGYTGTEANYNQQLVGLGDIGAVLDQINGEEPSSGGGTSLEFVTGTLSAYGPALEFFDGETLQTVSSGSSPTTVEIVKDTIMVASPQNFIVPNTTGGLTLLFSSSSGMAAYKVTGDFTISTGGGSSN